MASPFGVPILNATQPPTHTDDELVRFAIKTVDRCCARADRLPQELRHERYERCYAKYNATIAKIKEHSVA